jgi:asparagine synthase (glutamine-hydrolysing)
VCGIAGLAAVEPVRDRRWLTSANDALAHRGPDDTSQWWSPDGRVGMAHRRLAIIDLSQAGRQPMHYKAGALSIVFNGELYNFRELRRELEQAGFAFRSRTDTEVVLAAYQAWGESCLARFRGMFAFALYDASERRLFLARDRAGEKPLFYHQTASSLRFASELKGLLANGDISPRIDRTALDCYLLMGFVPGQHSMVSGIGKLPAAHALRFELASGKTTLWRYWDLPEPPAKSAPVDEPALLAELESRLEQSVRRQLVSDVPLGVLLSGGMDSSLVTAMAARSAPRVNTFTIRFPGHGKLDETEHARLVARHFSTRHEELEAGPATVELLPKLARQLDNPVIDSSVIPTYLVSRLVRQHCTVALGGDGGDELFAGYAHYDRLLKLHEISRWSPLRARKALARAAGKVLPPGFKGRNWLQALEADLSCEVPLVAVYFDAGLRSRLLRAHVAPSERAEDIWQRCVPRAEDLLQRATRVDFKTYLAEDILVKVDRASMLNSLEVRAPFLDADMIEFAFARVPSRLKATAGARKILLRRLAAKVLPSAFQLTRKQGFSVPLDTWLRSEPWLSYLREVLFDAQQTLFDHRTVMTLVQGHLRGRSNGERLFGLLMFELWRREYRVLL